MYLRGYVHVGCSSGSLKLFHFHGMAWQALLLVAPHDVSAVERYTYSCCCMASAVYVYMGNDAMACLSPWITCSVQSCPGYYLLLMSVRFGMMDSDSTNQLPKSLYLMGTCS